MLRFIARSGKSHVYVLIKMVCLIIFQADKRQQMRQAGQRWTAFFGGESGSRRTTASQSRNYNWFGT